MKRRLIFAVSALIGAANLAPANEPKASLRVDVQIVSISPHHALTLVPALLDEATMPEARMQLQKLIAAGEATLRAWPFVHVSSGERSVSENNEECRYPVEFDPPQIAFGFGGKRRCWPTWGAAVPTTLETRNVGASLEVEALAANDQQTFLLRISGDCAQNLGFKRHRKQASDLGVEGVMEQPEFLASKIRTQLSVHDGKPVLLHVSVVAKPKPYVELWILRAISFRPQNPTSPSKE